MEASSLARDWDQSPSSLDAISYNSIGPVRCHLLDFVCYTCYNDIIFLTLEYRIYWNSICRCFWNVTTNDWGVQSWKAKVIILCHIWVYAVSSRYFICFPSCCSYFEFFVFSYCVYLCSGFRIVLPVAISA